MDLLLIGGTRFLGRAVVDTAVAAGHRVTLFNRGQSNPDLYPDLEQLKGNRDSDLSALQGRQWDAVIDTCGFVPRQLRMTTELLAHNVGHYTFISSISVYAPGMPAGSDESYELLTMPDETVEEITGETYGPLKVLCEQATTAGMNGQALHVRAGLIVGPHDLTDRFSYWPVRVARGGEVLAPGNPDAPVQFIDVRDIAAWTVQATAARRTGSYNVTGPGTRLTMAQLLQSCKEASGSDAIFTWVPAEFLVDNGVGAFVEMPLWVNAEMSGIMDVSIAKAKTAGLSHRPLAATIKDTMAWIETRPADYEWRAGMKPEREAALLAAWHKQNE